MKLGEWQHIFIIQNNGLSSPPLQYYVKSITLSCLCQWRLAVTGWRLSKATLRGPRSLQMLTHFKKLKPRAYSFPYIFCKNITYHLFEVNCGFCYKISKHVSQVKKKKNQNGKKRSHTKWNWQFYLVVLWTNDNITIIFANIWFLKAKYQWKWV